MAEKRLIDANALMARFSRKERLFGAGCGQRSL